MKTYDVMIKATVIKTVRVKAQDEKDAEEIAHGKFSVLCDGDEKYTQDTLEVKKVIKGA